MARSLAVRLSALTSANVLLPVAVLVFASGFFPFKPLLPGLATFEDVREADSWSEEPPKGTFDRVVFLVVDALRSDFVYGHNSGFEFTQSLIRDGAAIPFTAHATPPTVTMPRVKALTTGSVPSFADLIFNLDESGSGSTLAAQDTWLAQIKAEGGKLVFYGDDTWLRLFPGDFFERADGTSSFFVSDFTEVDSNVTRHVPEELEQGDWNAMIMHYLGLDHIGHKTGPNGPNMLPKQKEMDDVVRQIYEAMETKAHQANTLLVLAGDHGMNAGGNHGGSGPGETEPALLFASPKFKQRQDAPVLECPTTPKEGTEYHYYDKVEQSDLVPTLAGLMSLPISQNSLGVFIDLWSVPEHATQTFHLNGKQIKRIVEATYGASSFSARVAHWKACTDQIQNVSFCSTPDGDEDKLARLWAEAEVKLQQLTTGGEARSEEVNLAFKMFLTEAQEVLSGMASSYDIPRMVTGMVVAAMGLLLAYITLPSPWLVGSAGLFFALICGLYGAMMFASSYVEEEQHLWYWLTPAWFTVLTAQSVHRSAGTQHKTRLAAAGALLLVVHRIAIRWNQTGQKHAGEPDIVHSFFPDNHALMWVWILITYGYNCFMLVSRAFLDIIPSGIAVALGIVMVLPSVIFKLNFTQADAPELVQNLALSLRRWTASYSLVSQAQATFALLAATTMAVVIMSVMLARGTVMANRKGPAVNVTLSERLHHLLTLFLITQSRAPNIPLFLGLEAQQQALAWLLNPASPPGASTRRRSAAIRPAELATSVLLLSHVYFFCMGGSNSISSVDLSNAYNGVADYNIVAVGTLLFASNWTAPIWWCSAAVLLTFTKPTKAATSNERAADGNRQWVLEERRRLQGDTAVAEKEGADTAEVPEHWLVYVSSMTVFVAASLLAVMAACTVLRTHLFIWTVFSPKYLYAMAWSVGWHIIVNIGLGSLLRWLGQIA